MPPSKHSKKRPLSLSLSQSSGIESSRIWRKKNISSQGCESTQDRSQIPMESLEDANPKRKLVEEWLERSNVDIDAVSSIGSPDGSSQSTVLLDLNNGASSCDKTDGVTDHLKDEMEKQNFVEANAQIRVDLKVESLKDVEDNIQIKVDVNQGDDKFVEDDVETKVNVKEETIKNEPGTSRKHETEEEEPLLQCPLCWKNFEKTQTQTAHLKACATANGLTTRQLIDAVDLHKKLMADRKKLGLFPMAPPAAANKKSAPKKVEGQVTRKSRQPKDNELELALALSLSLAQEKQESLATFGFTSKSNGSRKSAPVLLTRSQAERERLITEKVSIVLLEETGDSQPSNHSQDVDLIPESAQLREWCHPDHPLWKKSLISPSQSDLTEFYVPALGNVVAPSKSEVGAKLRHLSQLPGRINTPKKNEKSEEKAVDDSLPSECGSVTQTSSLSKLEQDVKAKHLSDWVGLLNNRFMSDVSIYVCGGMAIPGHKLVLGIRCPLILQDVTKQQNNLTGLHVDVILWTDVSNVAAMCFLEYVYYGSIRSIHTLRKDMSGLRWLADRYGATDLTDVLSYFERRRSAVKRLSNEASLRSPSPKPASPAVSIVESVRSLETLPMVKYAVDDKADSFHSQSTHIPEGRVQSPDLFSDEYDFALAASPKSSRNESSVKRNVSQDFSLKLMDDEVDVNARVESNTSFNKNEPAASCEKSSGEPSPMKKSFTGSETWNSGSRFSRTPERVPSPRSVRVSPFSDLSEYNTGPQDRVADSQRPAEDDDVVIISDEEETGVNVICGSQKRQDIESLSTVSMESSESPLHDQETPYISPVWDGFDDMPCDMESNWNDKFESDNPATRHNREISPISASRNRSPVSGENRSPLRSGVVDLSFELSNGSRSLLRPTTVNSSLEHADGNNTPPEHDDILDTLSFGVGYQGGSVGANKIHSVSDSASSSDESADVPVDQVAYGIVDDDLLNDSMDAVLAKAGSILERAEREHLTLRQPIKKRKYENGSGRVTPMKNYRAMTTPEIKVELQKFGLKPNLGKRKGVAMLEHIYNELHPWVTDGESFSQSSNEPSSHNLPSSQLSSSSTVIVQKPKSSSSSSSSSSSCAGNSDAEFDDSDSGTVVSQHGTKALSASELANVVSKHIEKDRLLHRKVLEYEPIVIENLCADLKSNGYKLKVSDLMSYLGQKCINYTSVKGSSKTRRRHQQNGNQRKKSRPDLDSLNSAGGFFENV